jgi:hypothetical protein
MINNLERKNGSVFQTDEIQVRNRPENNLGGVAAAMISILSQNYGTHNIASNVSALSSAIKNGEVVPFLKFDKGLSPIACAALVKINDLEVELGRAACIPGQNGGNGELMIKAFEGWKSNVLFPKSKILRAEVRTAKATKEVPGGQATQAICLDKIGFVPTAMVPMFHHGVPDRQEIFLLASLIKGDVEKNFDLKKAIPITIGSEIERESLVIFWKKFFGVIPNFSEENFSKFGVNNLEAKISGPIVEVKSSQNPNNVEGVVNTFFENDGRFALARISLDLPNEQVNFLCNILRKGGFRLAGFEPVIKKNKISIEILFGKLSEKGKKVMVLPSFTENVFNHKEEEILIQNSILWRQN